MQPSTSVLASKLRPPVFCESLTQRPRLERLLDSATSKVVLVVAPAGFGKTTLLSNWMKSASESKAWISLKSGDDNLPAFLGLVSTALAPFLPHEDFLHHFASAGENPAEVANIAEHLLEMVERSDACWTLVLDDYHLIDRSDIHEFISRLIDVMSDDCRLVISTRVEPPLPLARLRVHGELSIMTVADLRASAAETKAALAALGVELAPPQARVISERTAGWMTALHVFATANRSRSVDQLIQGLETFDGELDLLREFLLQEVLGPQPTEMQEFLLQISILDRFNVESCYAVTGNAAAGQLIDRAWRNGLFMIEADGSRNWYQFHPLFRSFLRRELNLRSDPDSIKRLHLEASRWFKQQNRNDEALVHAVAAGDSTNATQMVKDVAMRLLTSYRTLEILPWLESFPSEIILADADLSSMEAYHLVRRGRIAESRPLLEAAESYWSHDENRHGLAVVEVIRGTIARSRDEGAKMVEHGARALSLLNAQPEPTSPTDLSNLEPEPLYFTDTWMGSMPQMTPYLHIGLGLIGEGRVADGTRIVEKALRVQLAETDTVGHQLVTAAMGLGWVASGQLAESEALLERMMFPDQDDLPVERAYALGALAEVMYEWNRIAESEQLLLEGIFTLSQIGAQNLDSPLQLQIARVRLAQGNLEQALASLEAASVSAAAMHNRCRLNQIDAMRAGIALQRGDLEHARNWALTLRIPNGVSDTGRGVQESLTLARLHIASGNVEDAVTLLEDWRRTASDFGAQHDLIHTLALLSIAYLDLFQLDQAVEVLRDALEVGEAGGYMRVFIDEGSSMTRILRIAHRRGLRVHYVNALLEAKGETPEEMTKFTHADLVEPITARELDVLRLLALSLTNKEISDELYIAVSTVKRHITNLYGKLGVTSRSEAVQKARKLHLLSAASEGATWLPRSPLAESTLNCDLLGDMASAHVY